MSLAIDVDRVIQVLLADGWHEVLDDSFDLDAYEFIHSSRPIHKGGQSGPRATASYASALAQISLRRALHGTRPRRPMLDRGPSGFRGFVDCGVAGVGVSSRS